MKNYTCCTALLALFAIARLAAAEPRSGEWGALTNDLHMSINLEAAEGHVQLHEPVILLIRWQNLSPNKAWSFYQSHATERSPHFSFAVTSPTGKDISPKPQFSHGSGSFVELGPEQSHEARLDLSNLCSFKEVGNYRIIMKCSVGNYLDTNRVSFRSIQLVSNPLTVTVLGKK
jgi:hypothetical protein